MSSPIADLSYRGYDGPLAAPTHRWHAITRMMIQAAFKKKSYWVLTVISGFYYLILFVMIFFAEQINARSALTGRPGPNLLSSIRWHDQIVHGFSIGQLTYLAITILVGAGAIATDNRSNALLVYLSKPCTKKDYIIGKWFGLFIPIATAMAVPNLFFYLYGVLSYQEYGFLTHDKLLLPKLLLMIITASSLYASLMLGVSSLFNQARLAGASMAGLYILTNLFTQIMGVAILMITGGHRAAGVGAPLGLKALYYGSIDGLIIGFTKALLDCRPTQLFIFPGQNNAAVGPISLGLIAPAIVLLCIGGISLARTRVRAVEVVQ